MIEGEWKTTRQYLLGDLSDEEKARLEERFLSDSTCFEQLCTTEEELIEAYVHGALNSRDRERFEQYFMQSAVQRTRVERFQALASISTQFRRVVRLKPSWWAFGFVLAVAALVIAVPAPWLLMQSRLRSRIEQSQGALQQEHELAQQLREQQKEASAKIAQLSQRVSELASPQLNAPILDIYPSRSFTRSAEASFHNELTLRAGVKTYTLLLHSTGRAVSATYRLEIRDAADNVIWQGQGLVRQLTGEYVVTFPAELLRPGGYTLRVYTPKPGNRVPVDTYHIRIEAFSAGWR